jgi:hypothetical protein
MNEGTEIAKVLYKMTKTKEFPYFFVDGRYWGQEKDFLDSVENASLFKTMDKAKIFYRQKTIAG